MSEFADTGIPWVGDIPRDWGIFPLFSIARDNKKKNKEKNDNVLSLSYGRIIKRDLSKNFGLLPENFDGYQVVDDGYIIIRSTDLQNDKKSLRVGLVHEYGVITSAYIGLKPSDNMYPDYLFYYLNMCDLKKVFYSLGGGLRQSLRFEEFRRFPIVVPPIEEQKLISRYLDKKTEQIDRLVVKIKKKIELLKEQRTSFINQCVTKGLDPNVEMKDSGVEWIGEIPKHWILSRLKFTSSILNGYAFSSDDFDPDNEIPVIRIGNVKTPFDLNDCVKVKKEIYEKYKGFEILKNDILVGMTGGTIGKSATYDLEELALVNQRVCIFRSLQNSVQEFLSIYMESNTFKKQVELNCEGGGQPNIGKEELMSFDISLPPIDEQKLIIKDFLNKSFKNQNLIKLNKKRISILNEYRQSLISSVVTGKVRVTEDMI